MRFIFKTHYRQDIRLFQHDGEVVWYGVLGILVIAAPWLLDGYFLSQLTFVLIYAIAGLGLMVLSGFAGLPSIGHAAFLGVGAYAETLLTKAGWPFPLAMLGAALLSGGVGVAVGLPALRVKGIYLAVATLAFGFIVEEVLTRWETVTGGNEGLQVTAPRIGALSFGASYPLYYICLAVCALVTLGVLNLLRSSTGRAFIAIRDSEISAQSMGIDLTRTKTLSFVVSAAIVGVAGALYAHKVRFISPEQFDLNQSIDLLLLIVVGGLGSVHGAFFGAIFLVTLPQFIAIAKDWLPPDMAQTAGLQSLVYGVVIILFVIFEPAGIYGRWLKVRTYFELFPFYRQGTFRRQKAYQRSERLR
jgi:branched-chain amino acid transport system permease protein